MDQLVENKPDIVKRETVAKTIVSKQAPDRDWLEYLQQNRKLDMLTITEPEVTEEEGEEPEGKEEKDKTNAKKRVVMVMARQHPGEGPASYVVQGKCWIENQWTLFSLGLIDFLVSKHKIAQQLREKLIFKVKI